MLALLNDLRTRLSLALLYITHDIASARYFADEVLVMYGGQIVDGARPRTSPSVPPTPTPSSLSPPPPTRTTWAPCSSPRTWAPEAVRHGPANVGPAATGCPFSNRCPLAIDKCKQENPALQLLTPNRAAGVLATGRRCPVLTGSAA